MLLISEPQFCISAKRLNSLRDFILRKLIQRFHTPVRAEIRIYPGRYIAASNLGINSKSTFNLCKDWLGLHGTDSVYIVFLSILV